jgi:hypothetical protein
MNQQTILDAKQSHGCNSTSLITRHNPDRHPRRCFLDAITSWILELGHWLQAFPHETLFRIWRQKAKRLSKRQRRQIKQHAGTRTQMGAKVPRPQAQIKAVFRPTATSPASQNAKKNGRAQIIIQRLGVGDRSRKHLAKAMGDC